MKKLFTVCYCGIIVGTFSNRKLAWDAILQAFMTTQDEIKDKKRTITGEYILGDWRRYNSCQKIKIKKLTSSQSLSNALAKSHNLILWDMYFPHHKVTVQQHYLNDVDLPKIKGENA